MKIEQNSFFWGNMQTDENKKQKNAYMFGKGLIKQENPIEEKRKEAQKQAKKIVQDVVSKEYEIDEELNNKAKHINELRTEMQAGLEDLYKNEEKRNSLREEYAVAADSDEQKDLELLEKNADASLIPPKATLTEEEKERLSELKDKPRTEYQERMLSAYKDKQRIEGGIEGLQEVVNIEIATIKAINGERLKSHPVVDAVKQVEVLMKATNKEIQGMIIEETKDNIEEKADKIEEDAEKKIDEEKKQREKLDKLKEKMAKMEELLEKIKKDDNTVEMTKISDLPKLGVDEGIQVSEMDNSKSEIQKEIDALMEKMKLIEEDMKGFMVDIKR